MPEHYEIAFIGAGPAGYVGGIRAAQLGMKAAVFDRGTVGGTCLHWGCIPSKALIASAHLAEQIRTADSFGLQVSDVDINWPKMVKRSRKIVEQNARGIERGLFPKYGVDYWETGVTAVEPGTIRLQPGAQIETVTADHIVLATGSRVRWLPGWQPDPPYVISSDEALTLARLPQRAAIVGAGAIGCEFAYIFAALGVEVVLLELADHILPGVDPEVVKPLLRKFQDLGVDVRTGIKVGTPEREGELVGLEAGDDTLAVDTVLLATGRAPNSDTLTLPQKLQINDGGFIPSDDDTFATNVAGIHSVGDLRGAPLLAHKGSAEAVACVEELAGEPHSLDPGWIPSVVYTKPEIATVGRTAAEAEAEGIAVRTGVFPLSASGRARAEGHTQGLVKVVVEAKTEAILGVQITADNAGEMIGEAALLGTLEATVAELAATVHPHPTVAEALPEAATLAGFGHAHNY